MRKSFEKEIRKKFYEKKAFYKEIPGKSYDMRRN